MSRTCTVCTHPRRAAIDRALVSGTRHRDAHIPTVVAKAQEAEDVRQALDVVGQLKAINGATRAILSEARAQKNPEVALKAIDRIQRQIELQAKLLGDLDERPQVNVILTPEWLAVRAAILAALGSYGEAKIAVAERLALLEAGA